jgi:hypothetical protein
MMSAEKSDRLRRFDDVFRTLLVIVSILLSGALAFYKEFLPSDFFFLVIMLTFTVSICTWVIGTFFDGVEEGIFKILAWYSLMAAFAITLARLIFYSTLSFPRFVLTAVAVVSFLLSYPMFGYLRNLTHPRDLKIMKILLIIVSALFVAIDMTFV